MSESQHLQKLNCRCEVTAVKFICRGKFLLTAQGPFLSVYNANQGVHLDSYQLLYCNKIHAIRTRSISFNKAQYILIICFGARELSICAFNPKTQQISMLHSPLLLSDWIFDTKLMPKITADSTAKTGSKEHTKSFELAIGMMHNQVLIYLLMLRFDEKSQPKHRVSLLYEFVETVFSENTSILYSLSFHGNTRKDLMIAAGDCFNHLLLWNVFDFAEPETPKKAALQQPTTNAAVDDNVDKNKNKSNNNNNNNLSASKHENKSKIKFHGRRKGAIYGIKWSENGKYICYVSDDRSVQLWKFTTHSSSLQMIWRVYGHQARVFDCWISDNGEYVVSISEDSTCRVWNFEGELIDIFEFRYGPIWSIDVCFKQMAQATHFDLYHVALGGADASIRLHYFLACKQSTDKLPHKQASTSSPAKTDTADIQISLNVNNAENKTAITSNASYGSNASTELIPFQHHIKAKSFYQLKLPKKLFPHLYEDEDTAVDEGNTLNDDDRTDEIDDRKPNKLPQRKKKKRRGKKRGSTNNIRIIMIDSKSRIVFATACDIYRVANLSALNKHYKWSPITSLKEIFGEKEYQTKHANDEITTMALCRDLFSDYGHYKPPNASQIGHDRDPTDLLSKFDISMAKFQHIPEDATDSFVDSSSSKNVSTMSLNTTIKKTDAKIAENLHEEYERWLIVGTKVGRICIIDLNSNQNVLCFRAHDIGIISLYSCITSFQPETLAETNKNQRSMGNKNKRHKARFAPDVTDKKNSNNKEQNDRDAATKPIENMLSTDGKLQGLPQHKQESSSSSSMRFSLSASDLHTIMTDPSMTETAMKEWGNSSLMLFTSDGNGNITYWCFPLSELQKPKESQSSAKNTPLEASKPGDDNVSTVSSVSSISVKFDTMQTAVKSSASFVNPAKKQISAFCYLPPPKNILIVGDARGSIMLFSLLNLNKRSMHKPMQILKAMHGREPVSCIKVLHGIKYIHDKDKRFKKRRELKEDSEQEDSDPDASYYYDEATDKNTYHIVTGGKDGKVVEYTFVTKGKFDELGGFSAIIGNTLSTPSHHHHHHHNVRKSRSEYNLMSMVNDELISDGEILMPVRPIASTSLGAVDDIILNDNQEMIITGFRSTDFIVWNCDQDYVLFRWNCGGVKRPHDFRLLFYETQDGKKKKKKSAETKKQERRFREDRKVSSDEEEYEDDDDDDDGYVLIKQRPHKHAESLNPCRGWIFAYANTNISNAIPVFHLDFPSSIPLGSLSRPYHSSEIHALHWLLAPKEIFKLNRKDDIFEAIEDFVASQESQLKPIAPEIAVNHPLSKFFDKLMVASSGEDGLIQMLSLFNGKTELPPMMNSTATSTASIGLSSARRRASSRGSLRSASNSSARNSIAVGLKAKDLQLHSIENEWKYSNAFDEEMYDEWILNYNPQQAPPSHVIKLVRKGIMEQKQGNRFPLKCCDMVKKSTGNAYLFFAGGAKEYLQGYEVSYKENEPWKMEWKSLCFTGGDNLNGKPRGGKRWKKQDEITENAIQNMDLRIKSVVVIPSPKYYGKWLIVTGNSRGTIRAYTFDEDRPNEFQFEGEDSVLHQDNNSSSPVLSLTSTYSSETYYHFPGANSNAFSPFNHHHPQQERSSPSPQPPSAIKMMSVNAPFRGAAMKKKKGSGANALSSSFTAPLRELDSTQQTTSGGRGRTLTKKDRTITGYSELPPHLIFSGATDGWIRIWFWDIDSHSIQLVERLAVHQSGVNTISASWLDAKFINKSQQQQRQRQDTQATEDKILRPPSMHTQQQSSPMPTLLNNASDSSPSSPRMKGVDGLLTRRLAVVTGGDDQSMTLIVADFESTMSMSRAARKRAKQSQLLRKSFSSSNLKEASMSSHVQAASINSRSSGWKLNVIREVPVNTAHVGSVRSVAITPIITPAVVEYFSKMADNDASRSGSAQQNDDHEDVDEEKLRMNEMLMMSSSDDQRLKCWYYKFVKDSFQSAAAPTTEQNIQLLDECALDIGLPNCLSIYYIYNSGILLSVGGQGIQIVTLPFSRYLFKKIYYNVAVKERYTNMNKMRQYNNEQEQEDNRSTASIDSSFSHASNVSAT